MRTIDGSCYESGPHFSTESKERKNFESTRGDHLASLHSDLARGYAAEEEYDLAADHYRRTLLHRPRDPAALRNLAASHERAGQNEEALGALSILREVQGKTGSQEFR